MMEENTLPLAPAALPSSAAFEEQLQALSDVVGQLKNSQLPLSDALRLYEVGVQQVRQCQEQLSAFEGRFSTLQESLAAMPTV